jgi:hypothetical protein
MPKPLTMCYQFTDGIFVGVHGVKSPSVEEWQAHCVAVERLRHDTRGVLVLTYGGGPNSKQREELRAALREVPPPPTAILTASAFVRGIITSLNWFFKGQRIQAFAPDGLDGALDYIAVGGAVDRPLIRRTLAELAERVGVSPVPS